MKAALPTVLILLATALVPAASAAAEWTGHLRASQLEFEGATEGEASLRVGLSEWSDVRQEIPSESFSLAADELVVKTFYYDPKINVDLLGVVLQTETDEQSYTNAQIQGTEVRSGFKLAVFAAETGAQATFSTTCMQIQPTKESGIVRSSNVIKADESDNEIKATVTNTLQATHCDSMPQVRIAGDFLMLLWEWDATLTSNGQDVPLPSGRHQSQYDPVGSPGTRGVVSDARQQYLYVTQGVLQFPAAALTGLYVADAHLQTTGSQTIRNAIGNVEVAGGEHALQADALRLLGDVALNVGVVDGALDLELAGRVRSADADGELLAWGTRTAAPGIELAWPWILGGLVGAGLLGWRLSRHARLNWHTRNAMDSIDHASYRWGLWHCKAILRIHANHAEARIMKAFALARLHRPGDALREHEAAQNLLVEEGATDLGTQNAVEAAQVNLEQGREVDARAWLRVAAAYDFGLTNALLEAPHRQALRPFMSGLRSSSVDYA